MTARATRPLKGFLASLAATAIWGGTYVVSRGALEVVPPATLVAIRMALSAAALFLFLALSGRPLGLPRGAWRAALLTGLIGNALSIVAQFQGTALAGASVGSLVTTASPVVTVALAAATGMERVGWRAWAGLALALGGVWVLAAPGGGDPTGVAWLVLAAISWGLLGFIGGNAARRHDAAAVTAWACLVGAIALAPLAAVEVASGRVGPLTWSLAPALFYLSVVSTALAFALWVYGVANAGAVTSGLAFFAQPAVGALLGWSLLGEALGPAFAVGAFLILAGALVASPAARLLGRRARGMPVAD
ncbi:MAG TPA: DMT family transporter [Deinococcales bacterium]|nr:DMT family transporter [Deinococcales bacterium]